MKVIALLVCAILPCALGLNWSDCGDSSTAGKVNSVAIDPFPPKVEKGSVFTVTTRGTLNKDINDAKFHLKLWRKVFGIWIPIPCIAGYGSCTYDNGCQLLWALKTGEAIPEDGEACKGIPKGDNAFDTDTTITLPDIPGALAWLVSGTYKTHIEFDDSADGSKILCIDADGKI